MINGLQYSVLLDLPYLDPVRYCVVGPMHNLFPGTGKHMMEVWLKLPDNVMRKKFNSNHFSLQLAQRDSSNCTVVAAPAIA